MSLFKTVWQSILGKKPDNAPRPSPAPRLPVSPDYVFPQTNAMPYTLVTIDYQVLAHRTAEQIAPIVAVLQAARTTYKEKVAFSLTSLGDADHLADATDRLNSKIAGEPLFHQNGITNQFLQQTTDMTMSPELDWDRLTAFDFAQQHETTAADTPRAYIHLEAGEFPYASQRVQKANLYKNVHAFTSTDFDRDTTADSKKVYKNTANDLYNKILYVANKAGRDPTV